jgi:hypothetical protein
MDRTGARFTPAAVRRCPCCSTRATRLLTQSIRIPAPGNRIAGRWPAPNGFLQPEGLWGNTGSRGPATPRPTSSATASCAPVRPRLQDRTTFGCLGSSNTGRDRFICTRGGAGGLRGRVLNPPPSPPGLRFRRPGNGCWPMCHRNLVRVRGVRARNRDNRDNRDKPAFSRVYWSFFLSRFSVCGPEIGTENRDTPVGVTRRSALPDGCCAIPTHTLHPRPLPRWLWM